MTFSTGIVYQMIISLAFMHAQGFAQQPPSFTVIQSVVALDEGQSSATTLQEVECTDPEGGLTTVTMVTPVTPATPCGNCFTVIPCSGTTWCLRYTPLGSLDLTVVPVYSITLNCADPEPLTVQQDVQIRLHRSTAPVLDAISLTVTLREKETQERLLDTITCTDPDGGAVRVDLVNPVEPTGAGCVNCFTVLPCGTDFCLKFYPGLGTLDYVADPVYYVNITCEDNEKKVTSSVVEVKVIPNTPPVFVPNRLIDSVLVANTKAKKAGDVIFDVDAVDSDNDSLSYSLTTRPASNNFQIGISDGVIRAKEDLSHECNTAVTFEVVVSDGINPDVGPLVIDAKLDDANQSPAILNMDKAIQVPENQGVGTSIYSIQVTDDGSLKQLTYMLAASPALAVGLFEMKGSDIVLKSGLDFETLTGTTVLKVTVEVKDNSGCSSGPKTLTIQVTDVNEKPELFPDTVVTTVYEGNINYKPAWVMKDPDRVDSKTYSIVGGNTLGRFSIDPSTGVIKSLVNYDVDQGRMPNTVTLTVEVKDKDGLTDTSVVTLNILDSNDNPPVIVNTSKSFTVTACTAPGTVLGTLRATDEDSNFQNNDVTYFKAVSSGSLSVVANGDIVLTSAMAAGATSSIRAYASDKGLDPGPLQSLAPAYITVTAKPCPTKTPPRHKHTNQVPVKKTTTTAARVAATTAPTTTKIPRNPPNWLDENLPWIMIAALLMTTFLGLVSFLCWRHVRCRTPRMCRWRSRPKLTKPQAIKVNSVTEEKRPIKMDPPKAQTPIPPARTPSPDIVGPQDGSIYDFWKEKYNEDDILGQPNRNSKPAPTEIFQTANSGKLPAGANSALSQGGANSGISTKKSNPCTIQ